MNMESFLARLGVGQSRSFRIIDFNDDAYAFIVRFDSAALNWGLMLYCGHCLLLLAWM